MFTFGINIAAFADNLDCFLPGVCSDPNCSELLEGMESIYKWIILPLNQ